MRHSLTFCTAAIAVVWSVRAGAEMPATPGTVVAVPLEWLQEHSMESLYATLLSVLGGIVAFFVSTYLVLRQLRDAQRQMLNTQRWNVRKTSEETLVAMITGDFPKLMDRLILEFDWDILAHTSYDVIAAQLTNEKLTEMDVILRNVLRHLEVTCINMKNGIIDEEICFDYLRSIMTTFYTNCKSFIQKERDRRKEEKIFREIQAYAVKWLELIERESGGVAYAVIRKGFDKAG